MLKKANAKKIKPNEERSSISETIIIAVASSASQSTLTFIWTKLSANSERHKRITNTIAKFISMGGGYSANQNFRAKI